MEKGGSMKTSKKTCLFAIVCLVSGILVLPGQTKKNPPPSQQQPPISVVKCIDVIIPSFTATLVNTQVNTPGIEFPTDTVKLQAVLKNSGLLPLPADALIEILLYKNGTLIKRVVFTGILGANGSTWTWNHVDSFPHGASTFYMIYAAQWMYAECTVDNNGASFYVNENLLHAAQHFQFQLPK